MDIELKVRKSEELVLDTCVGFSATAKECLPLPVYSRIVSCEHNSACFQEAITFLV